MMNELTGEWLYTEITLINKNNYITKCMAVEQSDL